MVRNRVKGKIRIAVLIAVSLMTVVGLATLFCVTSFSATEPFGATHSMSLPEPASALMVGGGGLIGAIIRFARRRWRLRQDFVSLERRNERELLGRDLAQQVRGLGRSSRGQRRKGVLV